MCVNSFCNLLYFHSQGLDEGQYFSIPGHVYGKFKSLGNKGADNSRGSRKIKGL